MMEGLRSPLVLGTATAVAALAGAPGNTKADDLQGEIHAKIAIVKTGLHFDSSTETGSDTQIDTVVCEAKGPEIQCEVHENAPDRMPYWQGLHGHWLVRTFAEETGKNGETLPGKIVVEDRNGTIVSENTEIKNPGIFFTEQGVPFSESHLIVYEENMGEMGWMLKPVQHDGIVEYTVEEEFNFKEILGDGYTTEMHQGKFLAVAIFPEEKGKKYFVTLEKKGGTWQIGEKQEMPQDYDPWDMTVLDNYPGGPKIAVCNGPLGIAIHEPGNMKEPVQTFQFLEDGVRSVRLYPDGKFLVAAGLENPGFFIVDIEDPSNYKYIFGTHGIDVGFDEQGLGQEFLSYIKILNMKPLQIKITKYEPNSFDFTWDGSDEENPMGSFIAMAGIEQDEDGDTVTDFLDNCFQASNPGQEDSDGDGTGDVCETIEPVEPVEEEPLPEEGSEEETETEVEPAPEAPLEEMPEPNGTEEVEIAEPAPDVIESFPDGTEQSPEVVEPEDAEENEVETGPEDNGPSPEIDSSDAESDLQATGETETEKDADHNGTNENPDADAGGSINPDAFALVRNPDAPPIASGGTPPREQPKVSERGDGGCAAGSTPASERAHTRGKLASILTFLGSLWGMNRFRRGKEKIQRIQE